MGAAMTDGWYSMALPAIRWIAQESFILLIMLLLLLLREKKLLKETFFVGKKRKQSYRMHASVCPKQKDEAMIHDISSTSLFIVDPPPTEQRRWNGRYRINRISSVDLKWEKQRDEHFVGVPYIQKATLSKKPDWDKRFRQVVKTWPSFGGARMHRSIQSVDK